MSKKALGKGIGALIKELEQSKDSPGVIQASLESIKSNPIQPRKGFSEEGLGELADSIREKGVIQPILVESSGRNEYTVIAGERRVRAAKMAGLDAVPVLVREYTPQEKIEIALIENVQREDLSPVEEALGYRRLAEAGQLSQEQIAKRVGKKRSTVANSLRLLKLPNDMLEALEEGRITAGHARAILSVLNPADQSILFDRILKQDLSVRQTEASANELNRGERGQQGKAQVRERRESAPEIQEIEQRLIELLGTKVRVVGSLKRGRIEISYFSQDDLGRLVELIDLNSAEWRAEL
jgi:ParB family chromosome partitioning protein